MPLHRAKFWDAQAARAARMAQEMTTPATRASLLLIAVQYKVLAERVRQTEQRLTETDCSAARGASFPVWRPSFGLLRPHGMGTATIDLAHRIGERFCLRQRAEMTDHSHLVIGMSRADLEAQRAVGSDRV
jgi:hypothetical protein